MAVLGAACRRACASSASRTCGAVQGYFERRLGAYLQSHGRRLIGWDEILSAGLDRERRPCCPGAGWRARSPRRRPGTTRCCRPTRAVPRPPPGQRPRQSLPAAARCCRSRTCIASIRCPDRSRARRARARSAGEPVDRARAHRGARRVHDLAARGRTGRARLVGTRAPRLERLPACVCRPSSTATARSAFTTPRTCSLRRARWDPTSGT